MSHENMPGSSQDCICGGSGEVWKYFKNEEEKILDQVDDYCPLCHPNLAQPIVPNPGQVEITYEEFNRLSLQEGWRVD